MSDHSSEASSWDARYASQELVWSLEPNQFVVEHLQHIAASKMVDLAGGEGRNALWFAARGWQVENVDFSEVALGKFLERAKKLGLGESVTANQSDATIAKFKLRAALLVVAYLQIPFQELGRALDNAISQLEPGATVFGIWHASRNLTDGFGGPPVAELLPTPDQLEAWASAKLASYEVFEVERNVLKDGVNRVAIDVILKGQVSKSQ